VTPRTLAVAAITVALGGCSSPPPAAQVAGDSASAIVTPTASSPSPPVQRSRPTWRQIVHDPRSLLYAAAVHPGPEGFTLSAWWTLRRGNEVYSAIVTSDDRFESAHYENGSWAAWARHEPLAKRVPGPGVAAFKGLLASPVTSLDPGTRAFVAGGDGATLVPFQAVARSTGGGPWQGYVVPETRGDRAYDEGDLVLPDGRFLVLLGAWSSDRSRTRPGPEYHGLWISSGDDWVHYAPYRPSFMPVITASHPVVGIWAQPGVSRQAPVGLVVATTADNQLYVSTDGARTFHMIRAR
jgi:hypothetical protein